MTFDVDHSASPSIHSPEGLTSDEAKRRLLEHGPNNLPTGRPGWFPFLLRNLWSPVPWLIEASLVLELLYHRPVEAALIAAFLVINIAADAFQEARSWKMIEMLHSKLSLDVQVLRDHFWQVIDSSELVPDDIIQLKTGDVLPADAELCLGQITIEKIAKTGASLSREVQTAEQVDTGDMVAKGDAIAVVTATGKRIRNPALFQIEKQWMPQVNKAAAPGQIQKPVFIFSRDMVILNSAIVLIIIIYALINRFSPAAILPFALLMLAVLIPAGLPTVFNRIKLLGATELAMKGMLVFQKDAMEKMAKMQVLCLDRAGLLTENRLTVAALLPYPPYTEEDLLRLAALASDETTHNSMDIAILERARLAKTLPDFSQRVAYRPYNSLVKRWEAIYETDGQVLRVIKGSPNVLFKLVGSDNGLDREASRLASLGNQVLAVAVGDDTQLQIAGLLALKDPLRADITPLINQFQELRVNVVMVTSDELKAAKAVAHQIGVGDKAYPMQSVYHLVRLPNIDCNALHRITYAEALPEDKVKLVELYQRSQCVVGITGNGENDINALRQADVGIATVKAASAARVSAGLIQTNSGLASIIDAIRISRQVSQQMLAYALTTLVMSLVTALFIGLEWVLAGTIVITPILLILLLVTNSLLKMTIPSARTSTAILPYQVSDQSFTWLVLSLAVPALLLCYAVFWAGKMFFHLPLTSLQTLVFILLVFFEQGMYYLLRERGYAWINLPNKNLLIAPLAILLIVTLFATRGILVNPIPLALIGWLLGFLLLYLLALDILKIHLFQWLDI